MLLAGAEGARALPLQSYTDTSVLASGSFIKVAVDDDGLYMIPLATLRSWGFSDASQVRVFGYGGRRLPDELSASTYIDDLPQAQSVLTDKGLVFYALGSKDYATTAGGVKYRVQNDYSDYGYYYVGVPGEDTPLREFQTTATAGASSPQTTYTAIAHHELEQTAVPGEAGPLMLGEDFRYTRSRNFTLPTPGAVEGPASMRTSFFGALSGATGSLAFSVNSQSLPRNNTERVDIKGTSHYVHGVLATPVHTFTYIGGNNAIVGITFTTAGSCTGAWLNSINLNYTADLRIPAAGYLSFSSAAQQLALAGANAQTTVWDVTDARDIKIVNTAVASGLASWDTGRATERRYAAWNPGASIPAPRTVGRVKTQNLHADRDLDMVIVTPAAFADQAERLAEYHRSSADTLTVKVVLADDIYDEFASGSPDPGAFRRYFKMLYDRGLAGDGRTLRYALLMGRTTIDNRGRSAVAPSYPTIPSWMPQAESASLSDNTGYCSDDITAMLADGSGLDTRRDALSIAIGRIPVVSVDEARTVVDKALQYALSSQKTAWKHRFMFLADDQDNGIHLQQTETLISGLTKAEGQQHFLRKVYMDAYPFVGSSFPEARAAMFRYLDEGVVWWNFIGHANTTGWTHENQLSYSDLNNMYLRHWPFIYAATCDFLRIDGNDISGGEILYKERYGGAIGIISAVRPVYISDNGLLSAAMGRALAQRDGHGRLLTPGEIYRRAKNDIRSSDGTPAADSNRLRYVFIGDPALRLAMPSNVVRVDSIGGLPVDSDEQHILPALGRIDVAGCVTAPDGSLLENFNGVISLEIYDSERSLSTLGHGEAGTIEHFEDYGERVYAGSAQVRDGRFSLNVAMPSEIAQNFRPATMSLYAYSTEDDTEATGLWRDFYVYGYDESREPDKNAPVIESMVLNHSSFTNGSVVNQSPMLIASVRDDVGINVSNAGIGHQITVTVDGNKSFTDVPYYYTPSSDGSPSGVINYPIDELQAGNHTLSLKVWDTAGNSASKEIEFFVQENLAPKVYDVYTDANPASTQANFYLSHDQPDQMVTVYVTVYNLVGSPVWSGSASGRSDMFLSVPVTWDLTDTSGRRVNRGIYLYRAWITSDGQTYETASRRIAVTAK